MVEGWRFWGMKWFLLGFFLLVTSGWAATPFAHEKTGIALPEMIAGAKLGEAKPYGKGAAAGVAVPYQSETIEVTIFIRPVDAAAKETAETMVEESLAAVKILEKQGTYSEVKVFKGNEDAANPGWAKGAFTARAGGAPVVSFIYGTIKGDQMIQLRITTPKPTGAVEKFVTEFQKIVNEAVPK
jgi:hypothetical protein